MAKVMTAAPAGSPLGAARPRRRGETRWFYAREALAQAALVIMIVAVIWGSIVLHLTQQRQEVTEHARRDSANLAHAAAESIGQTIAGVDDALRFMTAVYLSDPKHFDIAVWAGRANRTRGVAVEFAVFGPDGKLSASSLGLDNAPTDYSDRDFFKAHVDDPADSLFVSRPIQGRASGRWSMLFSRRISGADGWFMGVMAASVDPLWLTQVHRNLDLGRGALILTGSDGLVRALSLATPPKAGEGIGQDISGSPLLAMAAGAEHGTVIWVSPFDNTRQIVSFQRLRDTGSIVAVALDESDVFAPFEHYARQYRIFGIGLTVMILLMGVALLLNTRQLVLSRRVLTDAMDAISQGIVMVDRKQRVRVVNRLAHDLVLEPLADTSFAAAESDAIHEETRADGAVVEVRTHPLADGGAVRTYTDISDRKAAEARIMHLAVHDPLTGLANRRLFADALARAVAASHAGAGCCVLTLDLDKFKHVNDRYGHRCGDTVLAQVADRLRATVDASDIVARFGGDEFCILRPSALPPREAEALGLAIIARLSEPYDIDGRQIVLGASVGVALCPEHGDTADLVLTKADTALNAAKATARGTALLYDPAMDVETADRRLLEQDLRLALSHGQTAVYYQPIFHARSLELAGFEALMRWRHPTRGFVSPDLFISIAEETGQIVELGEWVLNTALDAARQWPKSVRVSVNLSPRQFAVGDIVARITGALERSGLAPGRLTLELTEGVLVNDSDRALSVLSELKRNGIRIALDDFGTGYSSLSYLRKFPFDGLKIDKSFVMATTQDEDARTIVRAIIALAANLDLNVVAEGVETTEHLELLRSAGCPQVQGYLLGRPMPADEVDTFLVTHGDLMERVGP
jgi:diguanylate cyclase (GGDEF)-like protein